MSSGHMARSVEILRFQAFLGDHWTLDMEGRRVFKWEGLTYGYNETRKKRRGQDLS